VIRANLLTCTPRGADAGGSKRQRSRRTGRPARPASAPPGAQPDLRPARGDPSDPF
jgi:hypothetical protein